MPLFRENGLDPNDPGSILVVERDRVRCDSDAILRIYEGFGLPWRLLGVVRAVPGVLRDPVYRRIARNRYRLFCGRDHCWVAPPEFRDRIV